MLTWFDRVLKGNFGSRVRVKPCHLRVATPKCGNIKGSLSNIKGSLSNIEGSLSISKGHLAYQRVTYISKLTVSFACHVEQQKVNFSVYLVIAPIVSPFDIQD